MMDLLVALALAITLEGMLYALFPNGMKRMMVLVLNEPAARLRGVGLVLAAIGVFAVWLIRG